MTFTRNSLELGLAFKALKNFDKLSIKNRTLDQICSKKKVK